MFSAPSSGSGSVDAFPGHGSPDADGRDTRYHPEVEEDIEGDYCFVPDIKETLSAAAQDASFPETRPAAVYGSESGDDSHSAKIMSSRAYQLEMLNQSLKHNVIVAMDTGSGKTQVAVLRIKAELEKCQENKIIWFLAPTISLCTQQFDVIQLQIPSIHMRILTGNDNVHTWSSNLWGAVLSGTRVVVSTYQVLLDALSHAFIMIEQLSLIVFDEAHNCTGKNPGAKIMSDFYHRANARGSSLPSILGLTATPSIRSDVKDLNGLEAIMDAKCVSPTIHRSELLKCVKKPQISNVVFDLPTPESTMNMKSIQAAYCAMDIRQDPFILSLRANPTERNKRMLVKTIEKYDTYSQMQMKGFCSRSAEVNRQLGPWAADVYIFRAMNTFLGKVESSDDFLDHWIDEEKRYLADTLRQANLACPSDMPKGWDDISDKVRSLMQELMLTPEGAVGIIFVDERAMVTMLAHLLNENSRITQRYRIGTMVGTSNMSSRRKALYEFLGGTDVQALQNFRSGKINLLIATSVLEEGIDVPACNLVICFDSPKTPKSFIQRRGRARMRDSRLVVFMERIENKLKDWDAMEEEMKLLYEDDEREFLRLEQLEQSEDLGSTYFEVESTGARLDFDNAKQHLEHFCRILAQGEYVDSRPDYIIHLHSDSKPVKLSATVLLPSFIPAELRQAVSASAWMSEKNATKDAAFQAYTALYHAGLVNENLLPFKIEEIPGVETRAAVVNVETGLNPWRKVAEAWRNPGHRWLYSLDCFDQSGQLIGEYEMMLPVRLDQPRKMSMFLDHVHKHELRFGSGVPISAEEAASRKDDTGTLLALHFAHRWKLEKHGHVIRVAALNDTISTDDIGSRKFDPDDEDVKNGLFLIRDPSGTPFQYKGIIPSKPPAQLVQQTFYEYELAPADVPYLVLSKWSKRSDFLHPLGTDASHDQPSTKPYPRVLPITWATVDRIPTRHAQFGMFIPSIIHELEVMLIAKELSETLLQPLEISNLDLVREAISSRGAGEPMDYERLEFLGDSILKFCTSVQASMQNPDWPEGYLSFFRDRLIANSRLSRAAIESGLAKFILTKIFTGLKWRPLYVQYLLKEETDTPPERRLSTKLLADVVEALIGVCYIDGGVPKAMQCISLFIDNAEWQNVSVGRDRLFELAAEGESLPPILEPLEQLIGYSFNRKSLLVEAMTHASYVVDTGKRSLERLEFLGDAILDNIIVTRVFAAKPTLLHNQMHMLKTAMVNGDFLAFMTLELGLCFTESVVTEEKNIVEKKVYFYLYNFMRHASLGVGLEQKQTAERHKEFRGDILNVMENGTFYPWAMLAHVQAKKFFSDLFEALIGAVWVDSGTMEACEQLLERFGILGYLDRLLREGVNVQHPKEELGIWAGSETVTYKIDVREGSGGEREYTCELYVGQRKVTSMGGGVTREEVKTKAATEAVRIYVEEKAAAAAEKEMDGNED